MEERIKDFIKDFKDTPRVMAKDMIKDPSLMLAVPIISVIAFVGWFILLPWCYLIILGDFIQSLRGKR